MFRLEALAFTAALATLAGCTDAESRDAPLDEDAPAAEAPAPERSTPGQATPDGATPGTAQPDRATEPVQRTIPAGTTMTFYVTDTVSTETHDVGDTFTAELSSNVTDVSGGQVLTEGTPARMAVTQSTTRDGQSLLAFRLESIQVDGEWVPVTAEVTEADVQADDPSSGAETAAKIGVGTAAGALIGQILGGDTESTLGGAGVGAAIGTVVALTTRGGSATLTPGSSVTVELTEPLVTS